jgi:hypothetical protein
VAAELAEVQVNEGGIQECSHADRHLRFHSQAVAMEVVQVVLERDHVGRNASRVIDGRGHAATFLFGGKALHEHVVGRRYQKVFGFWSPEDRVWLAILAIGPGHESITEVAWVDERHGPVFRFRAQMLA